MKIVLFANTDWYLYNFRLSLALALRDAGHDVLLLSPPGAYGERLRSLGLRWMPLPMQRRSLNPLREFMLVAHLARLLRRERPDLIHSFTIKCAVYGSLAARIARVPVRVNAVAGMGYVFISNDLGARLLRPILKLLMRFALNGKRAQLILQNPDDVELFERTGLVDPERIRMIPGSGVDCSRFAANEQAIDASPTRVLLASRLLWDKGVAEYVDAARRLRHEGRKLRFLVAGAPDPGNPASVHETMIRGWVSEGTIEWLGHVDDMATLYAETQIVVLPSYREGLPKSLIEAAACGLAMISTDVPGCREVITDGVDGLLVPVGDSVALANAIARLDDDAALRKRLGVAAREKALKRFDERIVVKRTMQVYRELLGAGSSASGQS